MNHMAFGECECCLLCKAYTLPKFVPSFLNENCIALIIIVIEQVYNSTEYFISLPASPLLTPQCNHMNNSGVSLFNSVETRGFSLQYKTLRMMQNRQHSIATSTVSRTRFSHPSPVHWSRGGHTKIAILYFLNTDSQQKNIAAICAIN
jgi:hypothetical protein